MLCSAHQAWLFRAVQCHVLKRSLIQCKAMSYMRGVSDVCLFCFFSSTQYQNTKSFLPFKLTMTTGSFRTILTFTQGRNDTQKSHVSGITMSKPLVCHFIWTLLRTKNSCHHGWLLSDTKMEQLLARIHHTMPSSMVTWIRNLALRSPLVIKMDWWVEKRFSVK